MVAAIALTMLRSEALPNESRGLETLRTIRREFRFDLPPGYADFVEAGKSRQPLFNWGLGVLLSAMNGAAKADPSWKSDLRELIEASKAYWNTAGPVPGFDVLPQERGKSREFREHDRDDRATNATRSTADRYYDDNAWMVLALVEASSVLGDHGALRLAEDALNYVLSGEDEKLGGGIYWREREKRGKNTCSNAPSAAACLAVYEVTREPKLLAKAKELYAWTRANLQDPNDHLFWDSKALSGKVDKTKWSYNTALMIRSAAMLAKATGERRYAIEAEEMAVASEKQWFVDGRIADVGRFAHLLLESWTYVPTESRRVKARQALDWLWKHGRNESGWFGPRFDAPPSQGQRKFELIDQASAARAFFGLGGAAIRPERRHPNPL